MAIPLRAIVPLVLLVLVAPFLPILISGRWGWWEAWVYGAAGVLGFIVSRALALRRHPDLIAERARSMQHEDTKPWDKVLAPLVGLGGVLLPIAAGLDARFAWPPRFGGTVRAGSLVVFLAGYVLSSYALVTNRFFSGVVRIQKDRGHHVVSGGPYRWMRHPGYAGALLAFLATPFLLGSWWTCAPALLLSAALVLRTSLEDAALLSELPGYRDYSGKVRARLIPGVW